jgi:IS1 family transposase
MAIWLITSHKKGIASTQLAKDVGVTQKTAWFMAHRIRHAKDTKSYNQPLKGEVEVDETFVGGKAKNRHKDKRGNSGVTGGAGKEIVVGAIQRKGDVVARVVENVRADTLTQFVRETVSPNVDLVVTDKWVGYKHLGKDFPHAAVDHAAGEYVRGRAHTNTIEGYWSQLKRQIYGVHHWVSGKHLSRYVSEMSWRYNRREMGEGERLNALIAGSDGRLTYRGLIA